MNSTSSSKNRIVWIDLAKGICILLVVFVHVNGSFDLQTDDFKRMNGFFTTIRMPLYYTISGIFVSYKQGFFTFFEKKINRLLVPYCFFVILANITSFMYCHAIGKEFHYSSPLFFAFTENSHKYFDCGAVWFLVSLFNVYMLYFFIDKISLGKEYLKAINVSILSLLSFYWGSNLIRIPFFIDSSMVGLAFFYFGNLLNRKTNLLAGYTSNKHRIIDVGKVIFFFIVVYFFGSGNKGFYMNEYECSIFSLYICGACGVLMILLLSKLLNYISIISFIGRYSIIVLGVHQIFIQEITLINWKLSPILVILIDFIIVTLLSTLCIVVFKRFIPKFVAQEDLFHFTR